MIIDVDEAALLLRLERLSQRIAQETVAGVQELAAIAYRHAHATPRFRNRTGKLRRSIQFKPTLSKFSAGVIARAPYAHFVENGTRFMRPRKFMHAAEEYALRHAPLVMSRAIDRASVGY